MDVAPLIWQWSLMARLAFRDERDTRHTVSAGILDALGRGFLIATAGLAAGLMFGTAHLAALSLWTVAVAAGSGVACMIGSALVRNARYDHCEEIDAAAQTDSAKSMAPMPVVEAPADIVAEENRARRMVMSGRQREHGTGRGA